MGKHAASGNVWSNTSANISHALDQKVLTNEWLTARQTAAGAGTGAIAGGATGSAIGAGAGSVLPGPGTGIGALAGLVIGATIGLSAGGYKGYEDSQDAKEARARGESPGKEMRGTATTSLVSGGSLGAVQPKQANELFGLGGSAPSPGNPSPTPQTVQSQDPVSNTSWNMRLSQQLALSAGGTMFSTPTQWWGNYVSNQGQRSSLVGA